MTLPESGNFSFAAVGSDLMLVQGQRVPGLQHRIAFARSHSCVDLRRFFVLHCRFAGLPAASQLGGAIEHVVQRRSPSQKDLVRRISLACIDPSSWFMRFRSSSCIPLYCLVMSRVMSMMPVSEFRHAVATPSW